MVEKKLKSGNLKAQSLSKTRARRRSLEGNRRIADVRERQRRNDLIPELRIEMVAIKDLRPSHHRTRDMEQEHVERLVNSIASLGFNQPILTAGFEIIDGHTRVAAASALGLETVPAIDCTHLSPTEVRQLRLATNRIGELGKWNFEQLKVEFQELIDLDVDLSVTGFSFEEQDIVLLDASEPDSEDNEEDGPGEVPLEPVTRAGDIWVLDDHRVICGSALEAETYKALLAGNEVHAVLTDPPYNVPIKGNVSKTHDEFVMASGEMSDAEFQQFLNTFISLATSVVAPGAVLFVFMDWRSMDRVYRAGSEAGLRLINLAVWYKESGGMGSLYRSSHELVAVFCSGDQPHTNNVKLGRHGRDRQNVWIAAGANRQGSSANAMLALHATPKPVELCVDAILDVTRPGQTVLDAFLGSGTTLIAAEKTGRRCSAIELEPRFVDLAIQRWMRLTEKQAVLASTNETFERTAERRLVDGTDEQPALAEDQNDG